MQTSVFQSKKNNQIKRVIQTKNATTQQTEYRSPPEQAIPTCEARRNKSIGPTDATNEDMPSPKILQHTKSAKVSSLTTKMNEVMCKNIANNKASM